MSRTVPLAGQDQGDVLLVRFDFDTPIYTTTADRDIVYDSNTYVADGLVLDYNHPTERADAKVQRATLTLAPDSTLLTALSGDYLFQKVYIYAASLTTAYVVSGSPYLLGVFIMSRHIRKAGYQQDTVELELFSEAQPFRRRNGVIASGLDQKARNAGDTFFDFTDNLDGELNWGGMRGSVGGGAGWGGPPSGGSSFYDPIGVFRLISRIPIEKDSGKPKPRNDNK